MIDVLEKKMIVLENNSEKLIEKYFMMNLFDMFSQELPPLKECLDYLCTKKKQRRVVPTPLRETSMLCQCFCKEIFFPNKETNNKTIPLMPNLGKIEAADILKELRDPSKAISKMLSSIMGEISW